MNAVRVAVVQAAPVVFDVRRTLAKLRDPEIVLIRGGSCVVAPLGQVLAGPNFWGECALPAALAPADIARGKYALDVAGPYARPDVFRLHVNTRPARASVFDTPF